MSRGATRSRLPAILVLLVAAAVALGSGVASGPADDPPATPPGESLAARESPSPTVASVLPTRPTPTAVVTPTAGPTIAPTPVPSPTSEPTPTATERPPAPPTGLDDRALILERGPSGRREVALTFDAGEGPGYTEEILDLLAEEGIVASFGITGEWAEQNPELVRRMVDEGHMLINHTYDHSSWTGASPGTEPLSESERLAQLERTEQVIEEIAGYELRPYFRFTYGDYDEASLALLKDAGYDYALFWTCDTMAWMDRSPAEIAEWCAPDDPERGGPGAVILMHVAQEADWGALPMIIDAYEAAGYDFVTMEQLVQP